jgi:hypothetical protein
MSSRERTRRWRERRRAGKVAVTVNVGDPIVEALIEIGWLNSAFADSRDSIALATQRMLDALAKKVTRHDQ